MNEISGSTEWLSAQKVVPANTLVEWVYEEGIDAPDDVVYVDNLEIFDIDKPDLVIDSVDLTSNGQIIETGEYVLLSDRLDLNINSRNQGTSTGATEEFLISVYLSKDRTLNRPDGNPLTVDDILIRQVREDEVFLEGTSAVNGLSIDLDPSIDPDDYYLIAYIDDFIREEDLSVIPNVLIDDKGTPETEDDEFIGQIDEFRDSDFPGEANNLFVSAEPAITILALPDLVVSAVNPEPGFYLVSDEDGLPNVLDFDFTISNEGLAAVNEDIFIRILLSTDVNLDPENDYLVLEYRYENGLSAVGTVGNTVTIDPDAVDIRSNVPIGERLYFGVYIDTAEEGILELDETNNGKVFSDPDFIFSEVSVAQAFDFDDGLDNPAINDELPPYTPDLPWVGQTLEAVDGIDAAMSSDINNSETSAFETTVLPLSDTIITFRWKVSSQFDDDGRDALNFYVDDFETPLQSIAGEVDWSKVSVLLSGGVEHTLRWEYQKDALFSSGQDRGWVDLFTSQLPNLIIDSISVDDTDSYTSGDLIDTWSVTVTNDGLDDVSNTPAFDVQIRVSGDNVWGGDGEFVLLTITDSEGLAVGASRTYSEATHGALTIPNDISLDSFYYFGAYADWNEEESTVGVVSETNENDNSIYTENSVLEITPAVSLNEGMDEFTLELDVGGPGGWFGVQDSQIPGGASDSSDAVQSGTTGIGETSYLQATIEGPMIITFDWQVSSNEGVNFLEFSINEIVQDRISGSGAGWESAEFFIPAGTQEIRWGYRKTGGDAGFGDSGWVDQVVLSAVTGPELAITDMNYLPGDYVLDVVGLVGLPNQLVGTEYLDITIEAENQGEVYTGPAFTSADIEVRLSTDRIYGNADDIVLGTVNQVEGTLEAGGLMRFIGPIQLGDSIPAGCYYPMARIDANELITEEFEDNNVWVGENADVCIKRLPVLSIYNPNPATITHNSDGVRNFLDPRSGGDTAFDIDEGILYYSDSPLRLRFSVNNSGLGRVEGNEPWETKVSLRGARRDELSTALDLDDIVAAFSITIELGEFTVQELMEGRSVAKPDGDIVDIDIELALPGGARFTDILDADDTLYDYLWIVEVDLDYTDVIEQAEIIKESPLSAIPPGLPWWIIDFNELVRVAAVEPVPANPGPPPVPAIPGIAAVPTVPNYGLGVPFGLDTIEDINTADNEGVFGILSEIFSSMTFAQWQSIYGAGASDEELFEYAFNRNPNDSDTDLVLGSPQFPGTYGLTKIGGEDYLSIAFDFVTRASDLVYIVQVDDSVSFPAPETLLTIDGPFDELVGSSSLTGDGGLIEGYIDGPGGEPEVDNVLTILDQGYSARVTVQDSNPTDSGTSRFIRVLVNTVESSEVSD